MNISMSLENAVEITTGRLLLGTDGLQVGFLCIGTINPLVNEFGTMPNFIQIVNNTHIHNYGVLVHINSSRQGAAEGLREMP